MTGLDHIAISWLAQVRPRRLFDARDVFSQFQQFEIRLDEIVVRTGRRGTFARVEASAAATT